MTFGGWQKISLLDFPGKISTVLFTNGCVFRCSFCYNPGLVEPPFTTIIKEGLIDYIAMDIKAPLAQYAAVTRVPVNTDFILKSIDVIMHSGIPYEFRSTLVDGVHSAE